LAVGTLNLSFADDRGSRTDTLDDLLILGAPAGQNSSFVLAAPEERGKRRGLVLVEVGEDG